MAIDIQKWSQHFASLRRKSLLKDLLSANYDDDDNDDDDDDGD